VITTEETGTKPQERDVVSAAPEKNGEMLLGCSGRTTLRREQCDVVWKTELPQAGNIHCQAMDT
jgi:hypothetical protein